MIETVTLADLLGFFEIENIIRFSLNKYERRLL